MAIEIKGKIMMKDKLIIKISEEYSSTPKGRYLKDSKYNGQKFRENFLENNFHNYKKIIIDLDDLYGCPSSFREESFGGLARIFGNDEVLNKLEFIANDLPPLINIIKEDIRNANIERK
jgi:hypothetical protein